MSCLTKAKRAADVDWNDKTPLYFHIPGNPLYAGKRLQKNETSKQIAEAHINHVHVDWCDFTIKASDPDCVYDWPTEALANGFAEEMKTKLDARITQ